MTGRERAHVSVLFKDQVMTVEGTHVFAACSAGSLDGVDEIGGAQFSKGAYRIGSGTKVSCWGLAGCRARQADLACLSSR